METFLRVAVIYVFVMSGLRILGKREFSQLAPFDLVTLLLIPELVGEALVRDDASMANALVAVSALFLLVFFTSAFSHISRRFRDLTGGTPTVLVRHGEFLEESMNRERIGPDEIYGEMHKTGLERIDQVKWAILETDGRISFIPFRQEEKQIKRDYGEEMAV